MQLIYVGWGGAIGVTALFAYLWRRGVADRARLQSDWNATYAILTSFNRGVHKRIDEVREIDEAIREHGAELFVQVPALKDWIVATDEFLCRLRDQSMPVGKDIEQDRVRARFAESGRAAPSLPAAGVMRGNGAGTTPGVLHLY